MTTFMKTELKISDDQTNIDKYRLAANFTENHIISYNESLQHNIGFGIPIEFTSQRKKNIQIGP